MFFNWILFSQAQTKNDVNIGIIFLGTRLCMQEISYKSSESQSTALVLLNTRMMTGYKSIEEMLKPNSKVPWGNRSTFLHVPMPKFKDHRSSNPLEFVWTASKIIKKKKSSLGFYLTGRLLEIVKKLRGPEIHTWSYSSPITHYFCLSSFAFFFKLKKEKEKKTLIKLIYVFWQPFNN